MEIVDYDISQPGHERRKLVFDCPLRQGKKCEVLLKPCWHAHGCRRCYCLRPRRRPIPPQYGMGAKGRVEANRRSAEGWNAIHRLVARLWE